MALFNTAATSSLRRAVAGPSSLVATASRGIATTAPRSLATPVQEPHPSAESSAKAPSTKPQHLKDFKIYRWVSGRVPCWGSAPLYTVPPSYMRLC